MLTPTKAPINIPIMIPKNILFFLDIFHIDVHANNALNSTKISLCYKSNPKERILSKRKGLLLL